MLCTFHRFQSPQRRGKGWDSSLQLGAERLAAGHRIPTFWTFRKPPFLIRFSTGPCSPPRTKVGCYSPFRAFSGQSANLPTFWGFSRFADAESARSAPQEPISPSANRGGAQVRGGEWRLTNGECRVFRCQVSGSRSITWHLFCRDAPDPPSRRELPRACPRVRLPGAKRRLFTELRGRPGRRGRTRAVAAESSSGSQTAPLGT